MDSDPPDDLNELCPGCEAPTWMCVCPGCRECRAATDDGCVCLVRPLWKTVQAVLDGGMMPDAGGR